MAAQQAQTKTTFTLDLRVVSVILLLVIAGMLALWRPWEAPRTGERTVEVTGQATITAVPDSFEFYPMYQFQNADRQQALAELTQKSNEVTAKLKELGVSENKIKTNTDGYDQPVYRENETTPTYNLRLTISVDTQELAQKVQDYLVTTNPSGAVSPQATFSDQKRAELENQAREQANQDAKAKAEQYAKSLGFGLGEVKTVQDQTGFGTWPVGRAEDATNASDKLPVQPGENELTYRVVVTYFLR